MNKLDFIKKLKSNNIDYTHFEKYLNQGDAILDYQAGFGRDSIHFSENYDVTAINISAELAAQLSAKILKSFCVDVREAKFMNHFHAIWVYESFAELELDILAETLDSMFLALKKDGVIQINLDQEKIEAFDFDQMAKRHKFIIEDKEKITNPNLVSEFAYYRYILRRGSLMSK